MRSRLLSSSGGRRTMVLVFDIGDEVAEGLTAFATEHGLTGASLTAIGALREATLGYWNWETKQYERIEIGEQVEVVSLSGNIAAGPGGEPKLHAHVVLAKRDGSAHGGHLLRGIVRPTLEVVLTELPAELHRRTDQATGLALLAP